MIESEDHALQVAQERAANNGWPIKETLGDQLASNRRMIALDDDEPPMLTYFEQD